MMLLNVPYFKQETAYTCGAATLRMVLAFYGKTFSEEEIGKEIGTNEATGTERARMGEIIKQHALSPRERSDASLEDLRFLYTEGLPSIVRFTEPSQNVDHYGVVVGIDETYIFIHDPWNGPEMVLELGKFLVRWPCPHIKGQTCWLLGVSRA